MYVSIGTAARLLGVCRKTLRRWEEKGRLFRKLKMFWNEFSLKDPNLSEKL
ncbi:MAG: MerR family DNA-binding transcriptional regulator [Promethearchaeota archaeon]